MIAPSSAADHRAQMPEVQRRLARRQQQRPSFLERDIRRAHQQVVAERVSDRRERPHRARNDGHRVEPEGAARRSRGDVAEAVDDVGQLVDLPGVPVGLQADRLARRGRRDQVHLHAGHARQYLEHPDAVHRTRGPRHAEQKPHRQAAPGSGAAAQLRPLRAGEARRPRATLTRVTPWCAERSQPSRPGRAPAPRSERPSPSASCCTSSRTPSRALSPRPARE